jgi:hypothetical protein
MSSRVLLASIGITLVVTLIWAFLPTGELAQEQGNADAVGLSPFADVPEPLLGQEADDSPSGSPNNNALRREVDRLRADLTTLRGNLTTLRGNLITVHEQLKNVAEKQAAEEDDPFDEQTALMPPLDPLEREAFTVEQSRATTITRTQLLDASLRMEAIDSGWSAEARGAIEQALAKALEGSWVQSIECRSTLCRLEVAHQDASGREAFEQHFDLQASGLLSGRMKSTEEHPDGSSRTVLYLFREGAP